MNVIIPAKESVRRIWIWDKIVITVSRCRPCVPTSSLRKQGSRRTNVFFSHLDPRVREDDGKKFTRTDS